MNILMVTSEAAPFAKSGGLADAVSALAGALKRLGHDVRVVLPRYYSVDKSGLEALPGPLGVPMGSGEQWSGVYRGILPGLDVPVYFIEHEAYFGREGLYGSRSESDYSDNPRRFSFFSRAAFQLCRKLGWVPDVFHAHDWPTGLVPVYRRFAEAGTEFSRSATVFTIHNLKFQGLFSFDSVRAALGLNDGYFTQDNLEFYGVVSYMKAGLVFSNCITTVSPSYAEEIRTPYFGERMDGILRKRQDVLSGILNGIDIRAYNPRTDSAIAARYDRRDRSGKALCK
ncbi:MAG TPA: glycogen/starch synthase, partial [Spirochaetales bacterium]|nr:glycogen/starch synthase [Spirochaetales bacterium]